MRDLHLPGGGISTGKDRKKRREARVAGDRRWVNNVDGTSPVGAEDHGKAF